jgi:hypothetical protein
MLFTNQREATVSREIKGVVYSCAPGDTVEIPDDVAHFVKLEGVALVPVEQSQAKTKPEEPPAQDPPKQPENTAKRK